MLRLMAGVLLTVQSLGLAGVNRGTDFHQKKGTMNHWKEEKDHCHRLNLLNSLTSI